LPLDPFLTAESHLSFQSLCHRVTAGPKDFPDWLGRIDDSEM
jgi:hypothetical protein